MKKILQRYSTLYSSLDVLKSVTTFEEVVLSFPVIFWFLGYHELFPKWCIYTALFLILWIQFKLDYTKYRLPRDLFRSLSLRKMNYLSLLIQVRNY